MTDLVWQPIETAPKDGREVLLYGGTFIDDNCFGGPYPFESITIGRWVGMDYPDDFPWEGNPCHSHDDYRRHIPTHWMPLPPAPEEGA